MTTATARARNTDPETSKKAAASLSGQYLRASQNAVLTIIKAYGPMTDHHLLQLYAAAVRVKAQSLRQSPSGLRTRRFELVDMGLVVDTGERVTLESGRSAILWAAA